LKRPGLRIKGAQQQQGRYGSNDHSSDHACQECLTSMMNVPYDYSGVRHLDTTPTGMVEVCFGNGRKHGCEEA
jgi:hypothetical protein